MWKLDKPSIRTARNKDIDMLIANTTLTLAIKPTLQQLYSDYDNQNGDATAAQLATIADADANIIHTAYKNTREGKPLEKIRSSLMANVFKCPYCSIQQPSTLDHYMPESQYKALAVCRMNLVPMCGVCNTYKGTKPYNKFVHCYYQDYPHVEFLVAKVHTERNRFIVNFDFDSNALGDPILEQKLRYQAKEIRLFRRLKKEASVFITTLCRSCECTDTASLKSWLNRRSSEYELDYGRNDWRCAVLRGMLAYPHLDISHINHNKANPIRIGGGGA